MLDSEDRIPGVQKLGPHYYNFWRDGKNRRDCGDGRHWMNTRRPRQRGKRCLISSTGQGRERKLGLARRSGAQARLPASVVSLSRGGADASVIREFDLAEKIFVSDGFRLAEAKSQIAWCDFDSVFVGTDSALARSLRRGILASPRNGRGVRRWRRPT